MIKYVLLALMFILATTSQAEEECARPADACSAYEIYKKAVELNKKGELGSAANLARRAISYQKEDNGQIKIHVTRISKSGNYITKIEIVEVEKLMPYKPTRIIREFKMTSPPKPYFFATFSSKGDGWSTTGRFDGKRLNANKLVVGNKGKSMLDDVVVKLKDKSGRKGTKTLETLESGAYKSVNLDNQKFLFPVNIIMSEKYGLGLD